MTPEDKDMLRAWRNMPEVSRYMLNAEKVGKEEHERWFNAMVANPSQPLWIITLDGRPVGVISLSDVSERDRRCSWGFYLASPNLRGKGVGSHAWYRVLCYAFGELDLEKVCGEVLGFNEGVLALHSKFGFKQEGVLRQHVRRPDGVHDLVLFGLLRDEWEKARPQIEFRLRAKGQVVPS